MKIKHNAFFAIDIQNSTELKKKLDYEKLLDELSIQKMESVLDGSLIIESDDGQKLINEIVRKNIQEITEEIFIDTNQKFHGHLERLKYKKEFESIKLFKRLGDSIIFECGIEYLEQIHILVTAFSLTVLEINKIFKSRYDIELKGIVWGAEIPVKNQIHNTQVEEKNDYFGIDIDKGFRLGNHTVNGLLTVSIDIIHLLMDYNAKDKDAVRIHIWKYEILKGMWNRKKYPIILCVASEKYRGKDTEFELPYDQDFSEKDLKPISSGKEKIEEILEQSKMVYNIPYIISSKEEKAKKDDYLQKHELREKIRFKIASSDIPKNKTEEPDNETNINGESGNTVKEKIFK